MEEGGGRAGKRTGGRTHVNTPAERCDAGADDRVLPEREQLCALGDREVRVADRRELQCASRCVRTCPGEHRRTSG